MELVANVWPVMDSRTSVVQRFMMRAYALEGSDAVIGATLQALAPTDFRMATVFRIPERFELVTEHGTLTGCVTIGAFHQHQAELLEPAFRQLEASFTRLQGIASSMDSDEVYGIGLMPQFGKTPYLVVTSLHELADGRLVPQVG